MSRMGRRRTISRARHSPVDRAARLEHEAERNRVAGASMVAPAGATLMANTDPREFAERYYEITCTQEIDFLASVRKYLSRNAEACDKRKHAEI
jgi:hypothetical protein